MGCMTVNNKTNSYSLIGVLLAVNSNNLGSGLELFVTVLHEFLVEGWLILDVGRLINATLNILRGWLVTDFSIGLSVNILTLDTSEVTTIAYIMNC